MISQMQGLFNIHGVGNEGIVYTFESTLLSNFDDLEARRLDLNPVEKKDVRVEGTWNVILTQLLPTHNRQRASR